VEAEEGLQELQKAAEAGAQRVSLCCSEHCERLEQLWKVVHPLVEAVEEGRPVYW
jgi:copper homeostasis protein CutC